MKDLIIAVADSYQEKIMEALLPRVPISSGTRNFSYDIVRNIGNDSGSYNDSHEFLRPSINQYHYALVIFDYKGTGIENTKTREQAEADVEGLLNGNGWQRRNAVAIIKPEVENWIWQDNPNVESAIGWERNESLYTWAKTNGKIAHDDIKPLHPKETLEEALRISETSKSSSIYKKIAATVSYRNCTDLAFQKIIAKLQEWFPQVP